MHIGTAIGIAGVALGGAALFVALTREKSARKRQRRLDQRVKHVDRELARVRRAAYAERALGALSRAGRKPRGEIEFRAEAGEDAVLWDLLGGQLDGFFIEAGAHDGYRISVSYAFEQIGWRGLLVEAIPERVADCRRVRPNARVEHAALGRTGASGTTTFTIADGEGLDVLSFHKPKAGHEAEIAQRGGTMRQVTVPMTSLAELLKDHQGEIDFFSLDVEGAELDVLDGMGGLRPRILMLEDASAGSDGRIDPAVTALGYVMAGWVGFNRVYVRRDQSEILRRAQGVLEPAALYARG